MPTVDIKTNYGAVGDGQLATRTLTTSGTGNKILTATASTWVSGDVGKKIAIEGAGIVTSDNPLGTLLTTIASPFVSATQINLTDSPTTRLSSASKRIEWGTNDSAAFTAFNTANVGVSNVVLNIPAGRYCFAHIGGGIGFGFGIPSLKVVATGTAWLVDMLGAGGGWFLGGSGSPQTNDDVHSARLATAPQGSRTLTLLDGDDAALFAENTYALISGYGLQNFGFPSNPYRRQWVYITDISGTTITLRDPLRYSFMETWPVYFDGNDFNVDHGGPATLYALNQDWACEHEYVGLNYFSSYSLFNANGRKITFTGGTAPVFGPNASQTDEFIMSSFTLGTSWEVDKLNNTIRASDSTLTAIHCQSASCDLILDNVTLTSGFNGTPSSVRAIDCTIADALLGPTSYGPSSSLYFKNCEFTTISQPYGGTSENDVFGTGGYSYASDTGVITRVKSEGTGDAPQWATPGNWVVYQSGSFYQGTFLVTDVYEDGTNIYIATNLSGAFPSPVSPATTFTFRTHPAVDATFINCTGDYKAVAWSNAPARHILFSNWNMTYTGNIGTSAGPIQVIGEVISVTVTIAAGYSAGTLNFDGPFVLSKSGGTSTVMTWSPVFALAGARTVTITRAGVTGGTGSDRGLTLPGTDPIWLTLNQITPKMSGVTGNGTVRIVIQTDQGIGSRSTMQRRRLFGIADGVDPADYYVPGNVDPAISTSDYYWSLGAFGFRPYDLTQWGSHGNAIATARGYRYVWAWQSDHPGLTQRWRDDSSWRMGFSNDPGTPPDPSTMVQIIPQHNRWAGGEPLGGGGSIGMNVWLAYNPDDPDGLWFYLYGEGGNTTPHLAHLGTLLRSADLVTWTPWGASHFHDADAVAFASAAFQRVFRRGEGDWYSVGYAARIGLWAEALWTSTDGRRFTLDNDITQGVVINASAPNEVITAHFTVPVVDRPPFIGTVTCTDMDLWTADDIGKLFFSEGTGLFSGASPTVGTITGYNGPRSIDVTPASGGFFFDTAITAQAVKVEWMNAIQKMGGHESIWGMTDDCYIEGIKYTVRKEEHGAGSVYPTSVPVTDSQYITLFPIEETTHQLLSRDPIDLIRLTETDEYVRSFPGPDWLQGLDSYAEDGIMHVWPQRGYITEVNVYITGIQGETLENGGSAKHQWRDYLTYIYDYALAVAAAPVGVAASCDGGKVTVTWYDALPQQTYRVYRGASAGTQSTLVGDVVGTSISFTPTLGQQCWIKVVTLNGTIEQKSRVVHCYVSAAAAFVNAHINRVIDDGGDASTIDVIFVGNANAWLDVQGLKKSLLHFADARCGVKLSSGHVVKIYDLGTTYLPRGRDLWALTSNTTYSATALGGKPAWTNSTTSAYLAFGGAGDPNDGTRFNQIRMKTQITCAALYQRTDTTVDCTFLGTSTSTSSGVDDSGVVPNYDGHGPGLSLTHVAGTPGMISFKMADESGSKEATVTASGASVQVAIGTYDGSNMLAYSDASAGSPNNSYSQPTLRYDTVLNGARLGKSSHADERHTPLLCSGSKEAHYNGSDGNVTTDGSHPFYPGEKPGVSDPPDRTFGQTNAKFRCGSLVVLGKGITGAQAAQLTDLLMGGNPFAVGKTP